MPMGTKDHTRALASESIADKAVGLIDATGVVIAGVFRSIPTMFKTRDESFAETREQAEYAMSRVEHESMRQLEDALGIDTYGYPRMHRGYSVHARNGRPRSRSEERRQTDRALKRLDRLVPPDR